MVVFIETNFLFNLSEVLLDLNSYFEILELGMENKTSIPVVLSASHHPLSEFMSFSSSNHWGWNLKGFRPPYIEVDFCKINALWSDLKNHWATSIKPGNKSYRRKLVGNQSSLLRTGGNRLLEKEIFAPDSLFATWDTTDGSFFRVSDGIEIVKNNTGNVLETTHRIQLLPKLVLLVRISWSIHNSTDHSSFTPSILHRTDI